MQAHTFGSGNVAEKLARLLTEADSSSITRRITRFIAGNNRLVHSLEEISNRGDRLTLATMLKKRINATTFEGIPDIIVSHAKNISITNLRARIDDMSGDCERHVAARNRAAIAKFFIDGPEMDFDEPAGP